jgi:hypothetical protein
MREYLLSHAELVKFYTGYRDVVAHRHLPRVEWRRGRPPSSLRLFAGVFLIAVLTVLQGEVKYSGVLETDF